MRELTLDNNLSLNLVKLKEFFKEDLDQIIHQKVKKLIQSALHLEQHQYLEVEKRLTISSPFLSVPKITLDQDKNHQRYRTMLQRSQEKNSFHGGLSKYREYAKVGL